MRIGVAKTLVPIHQRNHRTIDEWLKMVVEACTKADYAHAGLCTEMVANHELEIGTDNATTALKHSCRD